MHRAVLVVLSLAGSLSAQGYVPQDLDLNDVAAGGVAAAASRSGDLAVGNAVPGIGGNTRPARWTAAGTQFLPLLAGDETGAAYGVNDAGVVVGESTDVIDLGHLVQFVSHGVAWFPGQVVPLASLATSGDTDIEPLAGLDVNDHGVILGWGRREGVNGVRGFVLEDGVLTDLGSLQGTVTGSTEPSGLDEQGRVVGSSDAPNFFDHAFLWQDGVMTDLHELSGVPGRNSRAQALNEAGLVVGSADPTADFLDYAHAATWQDGVLTFLPDLGDVGGVLESFALDVNDHGTIVGTAITPAFEAHAVVWQDGQVTDLNSLIPPGSGWILANANGIANDGRIVGAGFTPSGLQPFVLQPDGGGGFDVYAAGCPGSGGFVPTLWGQGDPTGGGSLSLVLTNGLGGAAGLLLVGLDDQAAPFKGCTLAILPLSPLAVPIALTPGGFGAGQMALQVALPASVPAASLHLQALLADGGVPSGVTVSRALRIDLVP